MNNKLGFIGVGNMGGALATAACKGDASKVIITDLCEARRNQLGGELGCNIGATIEDVASDAKFIFLGVKPHQIVGLLNNLSPVLKAREDRYILVSMAAGVSIEKILKAADVDAPVLRMIPNTPVTVGEGIVPFCNKDMTDEEIEEFRTLMAGAGKFHLVPESLMDAASALTGCGPAFVYLFIEALADGAVAAGLPRPQAQEFAARTVRGAATMVLETGRHPGDLKDAVCSPGGSTIAGVKAMEQRAFRAASMEAVLAGYEKTIDLGRV